MKKICPSVIMNNCKPALEQAVNEILTLNIQVNTSRITGTIFVLGLTVVITSVLRADFPDVVILSSF